MSLLTAFQALLQDPPPEFAFEIGADGIAMGRTRGAAAVQFAALPAGTLKVNPLSTNVLDPAAYAAAVTRLVPPGTRGKRSAALILPDGAARIAILDFDALPAKNEELLGLIRFRLRKMLPFDVDASTVSYAQLGPKRMLAAVAPNEVISEYEAPFRALGFQPGMVTISSLSMLELFPDKTSAVIAKLSAGVLTVTALAPTGILLIRSLELHADTADYLDEVANDLYPTLAYIEDHTYLRPELLLIAGFGEESAQAATRLAVELELAVEPLAEEHPGLAGYLKSISSPAAPKAAGRKTFGKKAA